MERDHRRHAVDPGLLEGPAGTLDGLLPAGPGHDDLGDQRVEGAGHGHALLIALVDPDAGGAQRRMPFGQGAGGGGHEVAPGVLGVDPELDRVAGDFGGVAVAEFLAVGDAEHLADQVQAGDLLGDRMLHLEPGVDLQEGDGAVLADEELTGAGPPDVPGLGQDRLGGGVEPVDLLRRQERRRGLLDQLLVPALQRAVAGGDHHHVAVAVGQALVSTWRGLSR